MSCRNAALRFLVAGVLLAPGLVVAQSSWRVEAIPYYPVEQFAHGASAQSAQLAVVFATASDALQADLQAHCDAPAAKAANTRTAAQRAWHAAVSAWDALSAVSVGPLVTRRSARSIDFMPTRADMLARAILDRPRGEAAMELVGAPAKGFSALELLMWPRMAVPGTDGCRYAVEVGAHIQREARALAEAMASDSDALHDATAASNRQSELLNQWVGGLEQLRWTMMRKPLDLASSKGLKVSYPRSLSGHTSATWRARWRTLQAFAVIGNRPPPAANPQGGAIALETWLRSRGLNPLADQLVATTGQTTHAVALASPASPASVMKAAAALGALGKLVQTDVASAMSVALSFSDADGD